MAGGSRSMSRTTGRGSPRRIWRRSSIRSSPQSLADAGPASASPSPTRSSRNTAERSRWRAAGAREPCSQWIFRSKAATPSMPEGRILVVDDEEIVQDVLQTLLRKQGYEVLPATSAEDALPFLEHEGIDVVLLDLMLPGIGGMDALRLIRERDPEKTVIMMTAYGSVETAVEAMKIGAFHYLTKPFKNDEVLLLLDKALERRRLVEENRRLKLALSQRYRYGRLIGKSHLMQSVFSM